MAWTCSGRSNDELIDKMLAVGLITFPVVAAVWLVLCLYPVDSHVSLQAMRKVDRKNYVPLLNAAYEDSPQRIGYNATISAPHMHAHACENLLPLILAAEQEGGAILDVGSGSGYRNASLDINLPLLSQSSHSGLSPSRTRGKGGRDRSSSRTDGSGQKEFGEGRTERGESRGGSGGRKEGLREACAIHVGAAAPEIPQPLIDQLATPGRMFIPVGIGHQDIWQVDKAVDGKVTRQKLFGVNYVPLTDSNKQWSGP
ncbi:hypothetical protein P7C73_g2013, partial [Tremellales sp. Uapishka_1]